MFFAFLINSTQITGEDHMKIYHFILLIIVKNVCKVQDICTGKLIKVALRVMGREKKPYRLTSRLK